MVEGRVARTTTESDLTVGVMVILLFLRMTKETKGCGEERS